MAIATHPHLALDSRGRARQGVPSRNSLCCRHLARWLGREGVSDTIQLIKACVVAASLEGIILQKKNKISL